MKKIYEKKSSTKITAKIAALGVDVGIAEVDAALQKSFAKVKVSRS